MISNIATQNEKPDHLQRSTRGSQGCGIRKVHLRKMTLEAFQLRQEAIPALGFLSMDTDVPWDSVRLFIEGEVVDTPPSGPVFLTPAGPIYFQGYDFAHLASGIWMDSSWPNHVLTPAAHVAASIMTHHFGEAFGGAMTYLPSETAAPPESLRGHCSFSLCLTPRSGEGEVHAVRALASHASISSWVGTGHWRRLPDDVSPPILDLIHFRAEAAISCGFLAVAELNTLKSGDALITHGPQCADSPTALFAAGRHRFRLALDQPALPCLYGMRRRCQVIETSMSNENHSLDPFLESVPELDLEKSVDVHATSSGLASTSDIKMELVAVVGTVEMDIGAIRSLRTGSVVDLKCPAAAEVKIHVNGLWIGDGELIDINNSLAVQLVRVRSCP